MKRHYTSEDRRDLPNLMSLPDYMARDIFDVDFESLSNSGRVHVLTDLDLTLITAGSGAIQPAIVEHLALQRNQGIIESISIASNARRDIGSFAAQLDARLFQPFTVGEERIKKPDERFFEHILGQLGCDAAQAVMIGDRYSDITGANKLGIASVKVAPFGKDYWFDQLLMTKWRDARQYRQAVRLARTAQIR